MNLSASKSISMTFQGYVEEWNSNFLISFITSLSCLNTIILYMSLDFIILPFTADTAKKFPAEKEATERFRICIVT